MSLAGSAVHAEEPKDHSVPTEGYSSIPSALEAIGRGELVVVMDDEDRENEGDLVMAAEKCTPETLAFMIRHTSGVVCAALEEERLNALGLPQMVDSKVSPAFRPPHVWRSSLARTPRAGHAAPSGPTVSPARGAAQENAEKLRTAFCVTCDLKARPHLFARGGAPAPRAPTSRLAPAQEGITTGISAAERAATCRALADPSSTSAHFQRPGHVFPLRYRRGGVLQRAGHTEASVDLARLAGCAPAGVLCELVNDDGTMQRKEQLLEFGRRHGLKVITISDLIRFRRYSEATVVRTAVARLPTQWGLFACHSYRSLLDGIEHVAMVFGDLGDGENVLCRVHSECLTGDIFQSARCDCGPQLGAAMAKVAKEGRGVVVYLRGQEGRGIGLGHKLQAYNLQDSGRDTVEANVDLGLPIDSREYGTGAQMLLDLGVRSLKLMTNNPTKFLGLRGHGLSVTGRVPLLMPITPENKRYIETKRTKMGHFSGAEFLAPGTEYTGEEPEQWAPSTLGRAKAGL